LPPLTVRIILVETAGALNLGAIARVMQNMGLADLWLVNPQCDHLSAPARQMAVHAQAILEQARLVPDLLSALQDCDRVIATAGRLDRGNRQVLNLEAGCEWLRAQGQQRAIVFGREDRGLSNQELQYFPQVLTIDTVPQAPSLNLAQAVGLFCYSWYKLCQRATPQPISTPLAPIEELEAVFQELEFLLLYIGFLYPHTTFARMQKLRHLLHRSQPTPEEVTMLRGILRQLFWKMQIDRGNTPNKVK
jgi:tRNA/rRNA methyltransferase